MSFFETIISFFTKKSIDRQKAHEHTVRKTFQARGRDFKALLSANKRALAAMTNLEDAMRGDRFFHMSFIRSQCTAMISNTFNMIRHLNSLTGNKYEELNTRLKEIQQPIGEIIAPKAHTTGAPLVLPLAQANFSGMYEVGGKMASLGEALQQLGQPSPPGFVITAQGFQTFIRYNSLLEEITRQLQLADFSILDNVFDVSESLQSTIRNAEMPEELLAGIAKEFAALQLPENTRFAIRSSAVGEDAHGSSFAGQFSSELNIPIGQIAEAYKRIVASKYSVTAMTYRLNRGIPDDDMPMAVGVMAMIDALAGGVAYSADPLQPGGPVVINAVPGLPKSVVDGTAGLDVYTVSREVPATIVSKVIAQKTEKTICRRGEGLITVSIPLEESTLSSLTDEQVLEVAKLALGMEVFYGQPQDIEWAYTKEGELLLLQSRALLDVGTKEVVEKVPYAPQVIRVSGGTCVSPGIIAGTIFKASNERDMLQVPEGAILLVENAHSQWAPVLNKVSGIIAQTGGKAGHLASVAREYEIPALFGIDGVFSALTTGDAVTLDADRGNILGGMLANIPERKKSRTLFVGCPIHKRLGQLVPYVVPLNLINPESPDFAPASCKTIHDIIRFCHEKAVEEMFRIDASIFSERCGKQLRYRGSALQYYMVDIGEGFCTPVESRYIDLQHINSRPMLAIWDGMVAVPYIPHKSSGRGLLAVVAESALNPELEITSASNRLTRNYFLIDKDYCNLQASFGYHFCTVETQAGESTSENFVSFHFKGGAANLARRKLRVQAIASVLRDHGFIVDVKEDILSAVKEEISATHAYELLNIIGYIIVHSRQADASLNTKHSRAEFTELLRKGILQTQKVCTPPVICAMR